MPKIIAVGVDGSKPSMDAVRYALRLAKQLDAKLHLVHVIEISGVTAAGSAGAGAWTQVLVSMKESAASIMGLAVRAAEDAKVPHSVEVVEALDAARGLANEADHAGAGLIVVGSQGRRGIRRAVIGSVAERVVRMAACPVLVVR